MSLLITIGNNNSKSAQKLLIVAGQPDDTQTFATVSVRTEQLGPTRM